MQCTPKTILLTVAILLSIAVNAQSQPNSFFSAKAFAQDTLQTFPVFSGLSPLLVQPRQLEFLFFNALSTQKNQRLPETSPGEISRGTALQHILQVTYGASASGRFNIGLDLHYLHYRYDANSENSALKVLKPTASDTLVTDPDNDNVLAFGFHTFSRVGLRFRATPFYGLPELTLQGGILFPASYQTPATKRTLNLARTQFWLQGNFYQLLGEGLYGFAGAGAYLSLPSETQHQTALTPIANVVIAKEIPGDFLIIFAQTAFNASFNKQYKAGLQNTNYQWLYGLGVQVQPSANFSISAEFQKPFINNYNSLTSSYYGGLTNFSINFRYITGK